MLELTFREARDSYIISEAPGDVVSETRNNAAYTGVTVATLEAICDDDNIIKAVRVEAEVESQSRHLRRRLKSTTSEAGQAHQVAELIAGLENLECSRTTGEGQTLCVMSDSFNNNGNADALQASGDLPAVEVVKDLPSGGIDEGSAMIELTYDIASGATHKFNSAFFGAQTFAADIGILASEESCDVIVDDVGIWSEPSFRDGVIASAVDDAVNNEGILYFSSAGNSRFGHRVESAEFACDTVFGLCGFAGGPALVFAPGLPLNRLDRYFWPMTSSSASSVEGSALFGVNWDADIPTNDDIVLGIWFLSGTTFQLLGLADSLSNVPTELVSLTVPAGSNMNGLFMTVFQAGLADPTNEANFIQADFHLTSTRGFLSASDGSIFGQPCASKCIAVAAMDQRQGSGPNGAFEDPETSPVESFSARGPCVVRGDTREKPDTCAADGLSTSTEGFNPFFGTSAAAPVAAAIATIVRAACFPKVVGYAEILEMLTDYEYTIDYTSDGETETWGPEAGHGIISAAQMLEWVEANCADSCPGAAGCASDADCDTAGGEICCPTKKICEVPPADANPGACGDPHMTGFRGQKFDFTGEDGGWYAVLSALPDVHLNMRVTSPVPSVPEITYITGVSIRATDNDGADHTIVITVADPHSLDSECPEGVSPCLAEGALNVELDGEVALLGPGEVILGPGVAISAVNLPGACRTFGFEKYWERRRAEYAAGRRLVTAGDGLQDMGEWILGDPTATNMEECEEYVARAVTANDVGLFGHESEHALFQIVTPMGRIRLTHGRLHQVSMRDPTDRFDLPDHLTWQQNIAIDDDELGLDATGILGETLVPTLNEEGMPIMHGMEAIRGSQEHYRVEGPLGTSFAQDSHHS
eukprot:g20573.t1